MFELEFTELGGSTTLNLKLRRTVRPHTEYVKNISRGHYNNTTLKLILLYIVQNNQTLIEFMSCNFQISTENELGLITDSTIVFTKYSC